MSPATTRRICRWASITTLTMKSQPAIRAMAVFSSCTGLPSRQPLRALGCSRKSGPCHTRIVSSAARPGQINFRPPEKPAMKCGSIRPVVIFNSASDVPRVDPHGHAARALAKIRVLVALVGRDDSRCDSSRPLADRPSRPTPRPGSGGAGPWPPGSESRAGECPPTSSASRIGGSRTRLGTGRVTSLMTTQALRRPQASSPSGGDRVGRARLSRTAASGSANGSAARCERHPTTLRSGSSTSNPVRPYLRWTRITVVSLGWGRPSPARKNGSGRVDKNACPTELSYPLRRDWTSL